MKDAPAPLLITDASELERQLDAHREPLVGVDTEFVRETTYYPLLGLIQLGFTGRRTLLLDTPAIGSLEALAAWMGEEGRVCILHDAKQDLEIIYQATGTVPPNVFDTQLAEGFSGGTATRSLAALVEEHMGITLDKSETRSNWLKRPLTSSQLEYAADDVRVLPELYDVLEPNIPSPQREWMLAELAGLGRPENFVEPPATEAARIGGLRRLPRDVQRRAFGLAVWREETARANDLTRNRVVRDEGLLAWSKLAHDARRLDRAVQGLRNRLPEAADDLLRRAETDDWPEAPTYGARLPKWSNEQVKATLESVRTTAREAGVDPALVFSRKHLQPCMAWLRDETGPTPVPLTGWRRALVEPALSALWENTP